MFRLVLAAMATLVTLTAQAEEAQTSWMDEFDPSSPNAEEILQQMDRIYESETGRPAWVDGLQNELFQLMGGCYRESCPVFARVSKRNQMLYLAIDGKVQYAWPVSTGARGHGTPDFDKHPNGRIYDAYSSSTYPGGNWKGLGNMPYAVFISGGFAIHGTPEKNWHLLGRRASHGCIRVHPDNAKIFNRLVRQVGIQATWITVED
ncbi:MAG: L,D-transpeptidase [Bdellovibrionales bacterium]